MGLLAGTALTTGLVLEREIGKGGMGSVWIATNAALGSRVAVKVLRSDNGASASEEARRRFEQEARGLAKLDHPNLVRIFDFGATSEGDPFIVMELLRGEDLAERLVRGPIDLALASSILRQTCRALARAHDAGVIHRDIKPANIFLVESDGEIVVKVLDFGVARFEQGGVDAMTKTGALVGTPFFMSPEQHMNPKGIDHRSDLWSVAVVAFMCLTSQMPFTGETITQLGFAVLEGDRPKLRALRPDLPQALEFWMDRALSRDPADRYQSAKELAEAFDRARSASPTHVSQDVPAAAPPKSAAPPAAGPQPPAASAVAAPAPPGGVPASQERKRSVAPLLLGGALIAGLAGGGVWLATRGGAATTTAASKTAETSGAATATAPTAADSQPAATNATAPAAADSQPAATTTAANPTADATGEPTATGALPAKPAASPPATGATPAPPPVASPAPPSSRSGAPASGALAACWRGNAPPGSAASSATASFQVDGNGKASAIVISGPARSVPNFAPCSVGAIAGIRFGPGAAGPVTASASLPAIKK